MAFAAAVVAVVVQHLLRAISRVPFEPPGCAAATVTVVVVLLLLSALNIAAVVGAATSCCARANARVPFAPAPRSRAGAGDAGGAGFRH